MTRPSTDRAKRPDYTLRPLMSRAKVWSHPNGHLLISPKWRKGSGGVLSRLAAASRLQDLINRHLKRKGRRTNG